MKLRYPKTFVFCSICLLALVSCSSRSIDNELKTALESGDGQILLDLGSERFRSRNSLNELIEETRKMTELMKSVDPSLEFRKSKLTEILPKITDSETFSSNFIELSNNTRRLVVASYWSKDLESGRHQLSGIVLFSIDDDGKVITEMQL